MAKGCTTRQEDAFSRSGRFGTPIGRFFFGDPTSLATTPIQMVGLFRFRQRSLTACAPGSLSPPPQPRFAARYSPSTLPMLASRMRMRSVPLGWVERKLRPPWFFEAAAIFFQSDTEARGS